MAEKGDGNLIRLPVKQGEIGLDTFTQCRHCCVVRHMKRMPLKTM